MKNLFLVIMAITAIFFQGCYFSGTSGFGSASGAIEGPTIGPYSKSREPVSVKGTWMERKRILIVMNERETFYYGRESILTIVRNELRYYYPIIVIPSASGGFYSDNPPTLPDYDYKIIVTTQDGRSKKIVYLEVVTKEGLSGGSSSGEARDFSYRSYWDYYYRDTRVSDEEWHFIAWRNAARAAAESLASLKAARK